MDHLPHRIEPNSNTVQDIEKLCKKELEEVGDLRINEKKYKKGGKKKKVNRKRKSPNRKHIKKNKKVNDKRNSLKWKQVC